ncbi:hypothetical protein COLO4_01883, partial [Corchorus olitorius]
HASSGRYSPGATETHLQPTSPLIGGIPSPDQPGLSRAMRSLRARRKAQRTATAQAQPRPGRCGHHHAQHDDPLRADEHQLDRAGHVRQNLRPRGGKPAVGVEPCAASGTRGEFYRQQRRVDGRECHAAVCQQPAEHRQFVQRLHILDVPRERPRAHDQQRNADGHHRRRAAQAHAQRDPRQRIDLVAPIDAQRTRRVQQADRRNTWGNTGRRHDVLLERRVGAAPHVSGWTARNCLQCTDAFSAARVQTASLRQMTDTHPAQASRKCSISWRAKTGRSSK